MKSLLLVLTLIFYCSAYSTNSSREYQPSHSENSTSLEQGVNPIRKLNKTNDISIPPKWVIDQQIRQIIYDHERLKQQQEKYQNSHWYQDGKNNTNPLSPPEPMRTPAIILWITVVSLIIILLIVYISVIYYNKYIWSRQNIFYWNLITMRAGPEASNSQVPRVRDTHVDKVQVIEIDNKSIELQGKRPAREHTNYHDAIEDNQTVVPNAKEEIDEHFQESYKSSWKESDIVAEILMESGSRNVNVDNILINNVNTDGNQKLYEPYHDV